MQISVDTVKSACVSWCLGVSLLYMLMGDDFAM